MKFGRKYHKHQIAEWADTYMNYAALKSLCKENPSSQNLQELAARCMDALDSVDHFYRNVYNTLLTIASSRGRLRDQYRNAHLDLTNSFDNNDLDYMDLQRQKSIFTELAVDFDKIRWYGRVNTDGFRKIVRKVGHLEPDGIHIAVQVERALSKLEFANQAQCLEVSKNLNKAIGSVVRVQQGLLDKPSLSEYDFCTRLAKVNPSIPALLLFRAIESNNSPELGTMIDDACSGDLDFSRTHFFRVLLQGSIRCSSHSWVDVFIPRAISQGAVVAIQSCLQSILAEHCQAIGKEQHTESPGYGPISLLTYLLDRLLVWELDLLYKQDEHGRTPLHYACECGVTEICEIILKSMEAWEQFKAGDIRSAILLKDVQSRSPMHISILRGHLEVTEVLARFYGRRSHEDPVALSPRLGAASDGLLLFAVRSNSADATKCVLNLDVDINCSDSLGQTPLYLAARSGNETLLSLLLRYKPLVNVSETTKNWTPLIIASAEGFSIVADMLLQHGAIVEHHDRSGWTAIDHASYRGHIALAKSLSKAAPDLSYRLSMQLQHLLKTSPNQKPSTKGQRRRICSRTESYVVVNLGSLDLSDATPAVCLNPHLTENSSLIHPESSFFVGVSMSRTANTTYTISLPILEDATNIPWTFTTTDPMNATLVFEVFRSKPAITGGRELIGRGIALLDSYKRSLATKRESLSRTVTIPILSTGTLDNIGAITLSFIISTPLVLPSTPPVNTEALWFENGPSKVVGHRGLGRNSLLTSKPQIGENTIQSFLSAVDLGASYVELDVQLTKDHVPVIYHDFLVSETGIDSPMHSITYEQFMHISNEQSDPRLSAFPYKTETEFFKIPLGRRVRTLSVSASDGVETKAFMARVKHTFDYKSRGSKGNTRGDFIHESFITFEQLLKTLPPDIGMDIEISKPRLLSFGPSGDLRITEYPMLSEAIDDWNMDPFFIEANFFTDTILECLAEHISTRPILLSSFSPEICILLACKQSRWPIFFGTDSGNWQPTEVRATSLQEAVSFATKWGLDGIVLASEPFVLAPQLVRYVKGRGMVCATYGALNDEPESASIQAKAGVDIIIVNDVRLISETLAALENQREKAF